MKKWTYKLTIIDYRADACKRELIRSAVGEHENEAFNALAFSFPAEIDIEDVELLEEKEI